MKTATILFALSASFFTPNFGLAQSMIVVIDGSATVLTIDCEPYNGFNALPDGTIIQIREDQNADGPDAFDPLLTVGTGVGEWNYNQFALNGASALNQRGAFYPGTALGCRGGSTTSVRIFLAVMHTNNFDFLWWTNVFTINGIYEHIRPNTNFDWNCSAVCAGHNYSVTHNFELFPGGNAVPEVTAICYDHVFVVETSPACSEAIVNPATQLAGFDIFGRDVFTSNNEQSFMVNNGVNVNVSATSISSSGQLLTTFQAHTSGVCATTATANSEFRVDPFGAGTSVKVMTHAYGTIDLSCTSHAGVSVSAVGVFVRGADLLDGTVHWRPEVFDYMSGGTTNGAARRGARDPIDFFVHDVNTGELLSNGTLLSIKTELGPQSTGGGMIILSSGSILINSPESYAFVEIDMTSPNVSPQGYMRVEVTNGVVSLASESGFFESSTPPLGTHSPFTLVIPEIEFDYDLGTYPGHDVEVTLLASGGGQSEQGLKPEGPQGLIISYSESEIRLDWSSVLGASSYQVWVSETSVDPSTSDPAWTQLATTTDNWFIDVGAVNSSAMRFYFVTFEY